MKNIKVAANSAPLLRLRHASADSSRTMWLVLATLLNFTAPQAFAQGNGCGSLNNAYGPFDYRTERGSSLNIVEQHHFTPQVEALIGGQDGYLGGDLDYTLRAFPNHHRALMSVMKLALKTPSPHDLSMHYPFECYFERAVRFQRDDPIPRMIYATYLGKQGRLADAKGQLKDADKFAHDNPFTYYNIGMVYADLKQYEEALGMAHKAYQMGFQQPGLRDRLTAVGKWQDGPKGR